MSGALLVQVSVYDRSHNNDRDGGADHKRVCNDGVHDHVYDRDRDRDRDRVYNNGVAYDNNDDVLCDVAHNNAGHNRCTQ